MNPLVLIVEDDEDLRNLVDYNVRAAGYRTAVHRTGAAALEAARAEPPDLVLLDLMLPDIPGTQVCKELKGDRATSAVPVVMVTARGEEIDRVVGFELGADDYIVKPFSMRELLLRVQAVLRRASATELTGNGPMLHHGPVEVDVAGRRVFVDEEEIQLTAMEFDLLKTLLERRGRVQSRSRLLADVWAVAPDLETRTVDTTVKRVRQKLGAAGELIESVRGIGYRFSDEA